jgi:hypothetical protein
MAIAAVFKFEVEVSYGIQIRAAQKSAQKKKNIRHLNKYHISLFRVQ